MTFKTIKRRKAWLVGVIGLMMACTSAPEIERPRETWVFRSVLDERPRMVTAALHENLWVSYDARSASLYKAWKGGVNFDGAVYTSAHGPQPTSTGYAYISDPSEESDWSLYIGGEKQSIALDYLGHSIEDGQVAFNYSISAEGLDNAIEISEMAEYSENQNGEPGFQRVFEISGLRDGQELRLSALLASLPNEQSWSTTGHWTTSETGERSFGDIIVYDLHGTLTISENGSTELTAYFQKPGSEDFVIAQNVAAAAGHPGVGLIENSDCRTCHNETKKTVGPSYVEIAQKYATTDNVRRNLTTKIIEGGVGVWGEVPMTPHPTLATEDAEQMVDYILALDPEEEVEGGQNQLFLGVSSALLDVSDENKWVELEENTSFSGLAVNIYKMNLPQLNKIMEEKEEMSMDDIHDTAGKPFLVGTTSYVHLITTDDFGRFNEWVYHDYVGKITVEQERTYSFRLVSDDGSRLLINGEEIIDNGGFHGNSPKDGEVTLRAGENDIRVQFFQGAGGAGLSLQWANTETGAYEVVPESVLSHDRSNFQEAEPYIPLEKLVKNIPGDGNPLLDVHPAFDVSQARPSGFEPKVGGMDFFEDGRLVVCTWDSEGPVYLLEGVTTATDPEQITVKRIAHGLAEPLGLKIVDGNIYVLQKQELTRLVDTNGDDIIDEYQTVSDAWKVSSNFHEFAFGLVYKDGYFYATLATAILPGGASANPQIPDRGKVVKIDPTDGSTEFIASGLRTPNGIGIGVDGELFVADNQGDWLPSSKIVHVREGAWYGSRSVDFDGTEGLEDDLPVVWLPQNDIGNSPSMPLYLDKGPYAGQMMHGEVTHGGIKRVYTEKIGGEYQGAVFRFTQGLEAGVNRLVWGPDGSLYVGGIGNPGNWSHSGKLWFGLQKLTWNGNVPFEMLKVKAKSNGVEIEFTEPVQIGSGETAGEYEVEQWYYLPTANYGGPKLELESLEIKSVNMSEDRRTVFLELNGMKENHVLHPRIIRPFSSESGKELWTTEAWYTMNRIPTDDNGEPGQQTQGNLHNTLSDLEIENGWELLFDGRTTDGWRNYRKETIGSSWKVQNGELRLTKSGGKVADGGDIITDQKYENYEFSLEWKIQENGNSGIIYNVVESDGWDFVWQTGPEMQILDNPGHPDGRIEKHRAGDLYDLIECRFVTVNPAGEWNQVKIVKKGGKVAHWQNGYKVVEFEMWTPEWNEMVQNSKFSSMPGFGTNKEAGHIALQDHRDEVAFRNIKIRKLD